MWVNNMGRYSWNNAVLIPISTKSQKRGEDLFLLRISKKEVFNSCKVFAKIPLAKRFYSSEKHAQGLKITEEKVLPL